MGPDEVVDGGDAAGLPEPRHEVLLDTLCDHDEEEEEVKHGQGDQQVVEVALEGPLGEDGNGEDVGDDADDGDNDQAVATKVKNNIPQEVNLSL